MKNLKIMSMLLGGLLALGSLASCGSDNDEDDPKPEVKKATSATAEYVVNLSQSLLDAATVTIYYIDSPSASLSCPPRPASACSPV